MTFERLFGGFLPLFTILCLFGAKNGSKWPKIGPKNVSKMGQNRSVGVILDRFGGRSGGHFGIVLASFWGPFWCVSDPFGRFFGLFFKPKPGNFGGFCGGGECIETLKAYFEEHT